MTGWIGIDLGGTKTEVAVLDAAGQVRWRHREPTPAGDYHAILSLIETLVRQAVQCCDLPWPQRLGCGIPGCLDPHTQRVRGANTQVLNGQALAHDLSARLGIDVCVENDANCLALSEAVDGAGAGAELVFAVIVGTGCGGGLAFNGQVRTGRHALAGEWGHNPLPWPTAEELQAPPCWCGLQGCLETWVSGPGWSREHQRRTGQRLNPPDIVRAMQAGDALARQSVEAWVDRLGRGLAQVVNLVDPDVVVLGGGLSLIPSLPDWLAHAIPRHAFYRGVDTPVRLARHGDASGVRGAAWLARNPITR
jgi:fructokinase